MTQNTAPVILTFLFYLSGIVNVAGISVLAGKEIVIYFTSFLQSFVQSGASAPVLLDRTSITSIYPTVFSTEGCIAIILWGLAYISVAKTFHKLPLLCFVFFLEKTFYTLTWWSWIISHPSFHVEKQFLVNLFFKVYGLNDAFFALVFLAAFFVALNSSTKFKKE